VKAVITVASKEYSNKATVKVTSGGTAQDNSYKVTINPMADVTAPTPTSGEATIYKTVALPEKPGEVTITLASSGSYSKVNWYKNGELIDGKNGATSITVTTDENSSGNVILDKEGRYHISVELERGGKPYSRTIVITVKNS